MSDDATLLSRYAAHQDAEAFAEIVRRHAGLVHGTCRRICGNVSSADDATQECFLQLARHAGRIHSSLPAWLHTVAVRAAVRLRGSQQNASLDAVPEPATPELETWRRLAPLLDEALAELPEEQRAAIALRYLEGRSQVEIATMLGISQPTVSRRLETGVAALRHRFSEHLGAVGLPLVLDRARWQAPTHVVAAAGRVGLAGITPLPTTGGLSIAGWSLAAALLAIVGFVGWWIQAQPGPSPQPPPAMAAVEPLTPPPVLVPASPVLDRSITCSLSGWHLDAAADVLLDQLPVQLGERIEVMPADAGMPRVTLACDAMPLREALDQLVKDTGWRWRTLGSVAYLDRPMPMAERATLLAAVATAAPAEREASARSLVRRGDLDACGELLALLADKRWDELGARDPDAAFNLDLAVFHALAEAGATWQDWRPRGNPLGLLAGNDAAKSGVAAAWKRCLRLRRPVPPYICYLAGELRIRELADDLLRLVREPAVLLPGLDAGQPCQAQVIGRTRQWAILALGRMGCVEAGPELAALLAKSPRGPDALAFVTTLGALGNHEALPTISALPTDGSGNWFHGTTLYVATARLDPTQLAALVARGGMVRKGFGDGFIGYPVADLLPQVMSAATSNRWWEQQAFWKGTGRLPPALVTAAARSARETAKNRAAQCALDALLVRGGDEAALDRLVRAVIDERNVLPIELAAQCAARLSPTRGKALAERIVASIDLHHASDGALGLLLAMPPAGWDDRLIAAYPDADPQAQTAMVHILARSGSEAGRRFLLDRLRGADGPRIAAALDWKDLSDLALRRQLVLLLPRLDPAVARDLASSELISYPESAPAAAAFLRAVDPLHVDLRLVKRLGAQLDYRSDGLVRGGEKPFAAILQHWAQAAVKPEVRIASIECLELLHYRDLRSRRIPVISSLTALARQDPDSQLGDKAVEALTLFVGESAVPDGMELFTEASIMAGCLDDLGGLRALEQARQDAQRAIDDPGADVQKQQVENF